MRTFETGSPRRTQTRTRTRRRPGTRARPRLRLAVAALGTLAVAVTVSTLGATPAVPHPTVAPAAPDPLTTLVSVATERLELADEVAAAKWGTGKPVDDPVREAALLDEAAARSAVLGGDPGHALAVLRDQLEAGKLVQRGLHARWTVRPGQRPRTRPDLVTEIRPALDRVTDRLLVALRDAEATGTGTPSCTARLARATERTARQHRLDALHRTALGRALPSVCRTHGGAGA